MNRVLFAILVRVLYLALFVLSPLAVSLLWLEDARTARRNTRTMYRELWEGFLDGSL